MVKRQKSSHIRNIYLYLVLGNTLASSFIWGINTIFLLDAGLSNFEAFLANAFFTVGQVLFEIPTGVVADTFGRRMSYLLGAFTLSVSTGLYLYMWSVQGPFWGWALSSIMLGLGFTFFSGALEAWLVDALHATKYKGDLEDVFAKGQIVGGVAMLFGSLAGGVIAQFTNLGVPYILRSLILIVNFATAFFLMKDLGFTPKRSKHITTDMQKLLKDSFQHGLKNPPVRWIMLAEPFTMGVSFYIFYALQPFLLELYGDKTAYAVAGLIAALTALAQITGGIVAPQIRKVFAKRTSALLTGFALSTFLLVFVSLTQSFWIVLILIFLWGLLFAGLSPIRQVYINRAISSDQRATVLSFDSLIGSSGGIVTQPVLGKVADVYSYSTSYLGAAMFQIFALQFIFLAKKENAPADLINKKKED